MSLRASLDRLKYLLIKEFIQAFRDPRMRVVIFLPPLVQLFLYGYAFNLDVSEVRTAVADFDQTLQSRDLLDRFESSGYFRVVARTSDARALRELLDRGAVKVALQIDPGFARDLQRRTTATLQILVDGTDSNTAGLVSGYATRILATYNRDHPPGSPAEAPSAVQVPVGTIDLQPRTWYNPDLRSRNFFVPGVIAMILMLTCLQLTAMAVVREREIGTMEQLLVTPLRPVELIAGKTLPFALVGFCDVALVTAGAVAWFGVPMRGSVGLLFAAAALFLLSALGIGLFMSTVSRTQPQALMAMFFFFIPALLLSGFIFPIEDMPRAIQLMTYLNPLRHFLVIIRGIFLKGVGVSILWPELLALGVLGALVLTVSTLRFQRRLD